MAGKYDRLLATPGGELAAVAAVGAGFVLLLETLQTTTELAAAVVKHRQARRELPTSYGVPPAPLWPCADPLDVVLEVMRDGEASALVP